MRNLLIADRRPGGPGVIRVVEPATGEPFEKSPAGPTDSGGDRRRHAALPGWAARRRWRAPRSCSPSRPGARPCRRAGGARSAQRRQADRRRLLGSEPRRRHAAHYAGAADKHFGETIPKKGGIDITRASRSVVGLIVPWNFPMVIAT
jgi:hypothetical protein